MGQTARTTKLLLDLSARERRGTNTRKRQYLEETVTLLNSARRFYLEFFLAHPVKLLEQVEVRSRQTGAVTQRRISADKLLTWAEFHTVATDAHPDPLPLWHFSRRFPDFPNRYRRSVIKDCLGKARGYLTAVQHWERSGKKKGKPGHPTAANHPTLYAGTFTLELERLDLRQSFVRLKVYNGTEWIWVNYPTRYNRYFERRRSEEGWEQESPKLVLSKAEAALHFLQTKPIRAKKIVESKQDPDLVTVAVDLNVKQLAVITARQHGQVIQTRFVSDQGLDQARFRASEADRQETMAVGQAGHRGTQQPAALGAYPPDEHRCRPQGGPGHCPGVRCVSRECVGVRAPAEDPCQRGKHVQTTQPQASEPAARPDQSLGQRESLCPGNGDGGSESAWDQSVLLPLWREGREVLVARRAAPHAAWGQALLVPGLPLPGAGRFQCVGEPPSQLLSRVPLAAAPQAERLNALPG